MTKTTAYPDRCPIALCDGLLEITDEAYVKNDFDLFASCFHIPNLTGTFSGDFVIENTTALKAMFDALRRVYIVNGVITLKRRTLSAEFLDDQTIRATYVSQYVMTQGLLSEEIIAHGLTRFIDGRWQITENRYASQIKDFIRALHQGQTRKP